MSFLDRFINLTDQLGQMLGHPIPPYDFEDRITPETALEELKKYNDDPNVIRLSKEPLGPKNGWLLNTFQHAAYKIHPNRIVDMGRYLSTSEVFNALAKDPGTEHHVIERMFERCPLEKRPQLLTTLESGNGTLQTIVKTTNLRSIGPTFFYFNMVTENLDVQDTIRLLKYSPSFQIAKRTPGFASRVIEDYPQYKPLLD